MLDTLFQYLLFLAEVITVVVAILAIIAGAVAITSKQKHDLDGEIEIKKVNDKYDDLKKCMTHAILDKESLKELKKQEKKSQKAEKAKEEETTQRDRIFVLDFDGDVKASDVESLREEITTLLTTAEDNDEVLLRLESAGGMVHAYGLAASQLDRIKQKNIRLVVSVDKVAASGGYLMACVADKILSAPFAIIGSIGVVAQLPNFNRLLKKNNVDFEMLTAGEYKRTLTVFGENTEEGRKKFQEELEETHTVFKDFVTKHRADLNIQEVATGEHWLGEKALALGLVDEITTSDDYLMREHTDKDIYEVSYVAKKTFTDKIASLISLSVDKVVDTLSAKNNRSSIY